MVLKSFRVTIEEGALLHLLSYARYMDMFTVPDAVSQTGIARGLGIQRSHASSTLKHLKSKGLVNDRLVHFKGGTRKKTGYFLTLEGVSLAHDIRERVRDMSISLVDLGGVRREVSLNDATSLLDGDMSLMEIISRTDEAGVLDLRPQRVEKEGAAFGTADVPVVERFFGRERELEALAEWLDDSNASTAIIYGLAGMGKTTLVSGFLGERCADRNIFWLRFRSWDSLRSVLRPLSRNMLRLGRRKLLSYLEGNINIDPGEVRLLLEEELADTNSVLVFEDLHDASDNLVDIMRMMVEVVGTLEGVKMVVTGRRLMHFYDRKMVVLDHSVLEIPLEGLDPTGARKLLDLPDLDDATFDELYKRTGGHPLGLELIERSGITGDVLSSNFDISRYIHDEMMASLEQMEIELLEALSCFRYPCSRAALENAVESLDIGMLEHLLDMNMVKKEAAGIDLHPLIREFFYARATEKQRARFHRAIGIYYTSRQDGDDLALLEAIHHLVQAGEHSLASGLIIDHGVRLFRKGYYEELLEELSALDLSGKSAGAGVTLLHGHILGFSGRWDEAMACYTSSLEVASAAGDVHGAAEALNGIGTIHLRRKEIEDALGNFRKALDLAGGDDLVCSKIKSNIALIHWSRNEPDMAVELNEDCLAISERLGDLAGMARAYNNLGIIFWGRGNHEKAIGYYNRALSLSHSLDDKRTLSSIYNNLGEAYRARGDTGRAISFYETSLELARELGYRSQMAEVHKNLGQSVEGKAAAKHLERALDIYTQLDAREDARFVRELLER